jgi:hypothetical protein
MMAAEEVVSKGVKGFSAGTVMIGELGREAREAELLLEGKTVSVCVTGHRLQSRPFWLRTRV